VELLPHFRLPDPQQLFDKILIAIIILAVKSVKDWLLNDKPKQIKKSKKARGSKRRKRS